MVRLIAAVILLATLITTPAWANDSAFGGRGAAPMPLKNDAIEMVAEHVVLRAEPDNNQWTVTTDFEFRNTTNEKVDLQMGFPFVANDDEGDVSTPQGAEFPKAGAPLVWDFKTWVNGEEVKVKLEKAAPNPSLPDLHYDIVYMRNVSFEPNETVKVKNTYRHGISASAMQDAWVTYVLRTGGLWKGGKIGRSRLEVHAPRDLRLPPPGYVAYMRDNDGEVMRDPDGEKLVLMKFEITPPGARIERTTDGTSVLWDLHDFAPKNDLHLSFIFDEAAPNFHVPELDIYSDAVLQKMSKEELRFARNTISAAHGYAFKSADLQDYFGAKWWYVPSPEFDFDSALSQKEKEVVRKIKEAEGKAPSKPESDPLKLAPPTAPVAHDPPQTTPKPEPTATTTPKPAPPKSSGCATASPAGATTIWGLLFAWFGWARRRRARREQAVLGA